MAGGPATFKYAGAGTTHPRTLWALPSDLDGTVPPPAGAPNVAIARGADFLDGSPNDLVHVWRFHADFGNPGNTAASRERFLHLPEQGGFYEGKRADDEEPEDVRARR